MNKQLLQFTRQGQGEPLIVIHGLFGSSRNWRGLSKNFAQHYEVFTLDLRNHGESFHHDQMNYDVMAQDVYDLMQVQDISSAHILGHSMGGKVAMKLCHEHPASVNQLMVADIAPTHYSHGYDDMINAVLGLDLAQIKNRKAADQALASGIPDQRIRLFILQNLAFDRDVPYWNLNWKAVKEHMPEILGFDDISGWDIQTPSLFIRGELSEYVLDQHWSLVQQHFHHAEIRTVAGAGHWLHAEQPAAFVSEILNYLDSSA